MATLTIRNLDDRVKQELRKRAAARDVSMEQEARDTLEQSVGKRSRKKSILGDLRRLAIKPEEPFDLKKVSDEMWDEGLL